MNSRHEFSKRLGRSLAEHRHSRGLTQEQVAERLGVEQETISRFERGATMPPLSRLLDLTDVLGVPLEQVLAGGPARHIDQASDIAARMARLNDDDREWVRRWVVDLCQKLVARTVVAPQLTASNESSGMGMLPVNGTEGIGVAVGGNIGFFAGNRP